MGRSKNKNPKDLTQIPHTRCKNESTLKLPLCHFRSKKQGIFLTKIAKFTKIKSDILIRYTKITIFAYRL